MIPVHQAYISIGGIIVMALIALYQRRTAVDDSKVDEKHCIAFKKRIGAESDSHREHIEQVQKDISEIKSGIAYLKGRFNRDV